MPKSKPLHLFSLFCSVCKEYVEVHAEDKRQAEAKFELQGHQTIRVRNLRRGVPGVLTNGNGKTPIPYKEDRFTEQKKTDKQRKRRGSNVVAMNEEEVLHP